MEKSVTVNSVLPTAEDNIKTGLKLAYDALGVFPRIKVEEFMNHEVTELNMATYMWQFRVSRQIFCTCLLGG